jgi:hypothetical protein
MSLTETANGLASTYNDARLNGLSTTARRELFVPQARRRP